MNTSAKINPKLVVTATIKRADGTREYVGVLDRSFKTTVKIWWINLKRRMKYGKRSN
jgi:hypothetical protein